MPKSEDIVNLFQQFGGQVDNYHELNRIQSAQQAKQRWPLLQALELGQTSGATAPDVAAPEAPVSDSPIQFRPAPVEAPALAPVFNGQHLSNAELALTPATAASVAAPAPAPMPAPAPVPAPAPAPAPAAVAAPAVVPVPVARPVVAAPAPVPAPAPAVAPAPAPATPFIWAAPAPAPALHQGAVTLAQPSPLAALVPPRPPAPAPAPTAPTTELQGIFARLAGKPLPEAAPAPSALDSLWHTLRGGA